MILRKSQMIRPYIAAILKFLYYKLGSLTEVNLYSVDLDILLDSLFFISFIHYKIF